MEIYITPTNHIVPKIGNIKRPGYDLDTTQLMWPLRAWQAWPAAGRAWLGPGARRQDLENAGGGGVGFPWGNMRGRVEYPGPSGHGKHGRRRAVLGAHQAQGARGDRMSAAGALASPGGICVGG